MSESGAERVVPFHCPFCAETDLWPHEIVGEDGETSSPHGAWECRSCLRAFRLSSLGLLAHPANVHQLGHTSGRGSR